MSAVISEPLFYQPDLAPDEEVVLTDAEAHHVTVQRLRAGDAIALFDGRGQVARGRIAAIERRAVRVRVERRERHAAPSPAIDLYAAVPKGDRQTVLLDMVTPLGIDRYTPLRWRRSVADPGARAAERWQRVCIEACKQSRRLHVPQLMPPASLEQAIEAARAGGARLLVAHPDAAARPARIDGAQRYALFVGPEGGIEEDEIERLRTCGADFVRLGDAVLRIETACVVFVALMRAALV